MPYKQDGEKLRNAIKEFVYDYMKNNPNCAARGDGETTAEIFRNCGLSFENQENATASNQQYWLVALLRVLELDGRVTRDARKKWHIA